jgi:hypothetical protein
VVDFSDGGSTPPASTKKRHNVNYFYRFRYSLSEITKCIDGTTTLTRWFYYCQVLTSIIFASIILHVIITFVNWCFLLVKTQSLKHLSPNEMMKYGSLPFFPLTSYNFVNKSDIIIVNYFQSLSLNPVPERPTSKCMRGVRTDMQIT